MSESSITAYVNNSFTFLRLACYVCFSAVPVVCHQFVICIAPHDVDHVVQCIFVPKANADEGEVHEMCDVMNNVTNPYTWLMVSQWHHFLLDSNTEQVRSHISSMPNRVTLKINAYRLCQIMLKHNCGKRNLIKETCLYLDGWRIASDMMLHCDQIYVTQERNHWWADVNMVMNLQLSSCHLLKERCCTCVS